jgi:hypothetical protein
MPSPTLFHSLCPRSLLQVLPVYHISPPFLNLASLFPSLFYPLNSYLCAVRCAGAGIWSSIPWSLIMSRCSQGYTAEAAS